MQPGFNSIGNCPAATQGRTRTRRQRKSPWKHPTSVRSAAILALLLLAVLAFGPSGEVVHAQRYASFITPTPLPPGSFLIIGFMGGVEPWNGDQFPVRKMALELRSMNLPNLYVETVENRHRKVALELIRNAMNLEAQKKSAQPPASVGLILYGHSLGGDAAVRLTRELKKMGVPIRLTIQIDSVGMDDRTIPSNVARAVNFYQRNGPLIRGRSEIRAEDPQKTTIIGNFKYDYDDKEIDDSALPWPARIVGGAHAKMECDPEIWARVKELILHEIQSQPAQLSSFAGKTQ